MLVTLIMGGQVVLAESAGFNLVDDVDAGRAFIDYDPDKNMREGATLIALDTIPDRFGNAMMQARELPGRWHWLRWDAVRVPLSHEEEAWQQWKAAKAGLVTARTVRKPS